MVASLEQTTGRPRIEIVQSLKAVYTRHESNEYPFAIQESSLFRPYKADFDSFDALVVRPARRAFAEARRRLRPYPHVRETLEQIRARGLKVVALSDAPRNALELRIQMLELDGLFDAVYALEGYGSPRTWTRRSGARTRPGPPAQEDDRRRAPRAARSRARRAFAASCATSAWRARVLYVGDNPKKDMPVAQACGALGVWAEYGTYISKEYRERLAVISAKAVTRRHVADVDTPRWPLAIASFVQILDVLDGARWAASAAARPPRPLPGAARLGRSQ